MIGKEAYSLAIEALEKMGRDIHYAATRPEQEAIIAVAEEQGQKALKAILDKESLPYS